MNADLTNAGELAAGIELAGRIEALRSLNLLQVLVQSPTPLIMTLVGGKGTFLLSLQAGKIVALSSRAVGSLALKAALGQEGVWTLRRADYDPEDDDPTVISNIIAFSLGSAHAQDEAAAMGAG
jgi:hypothetical protein